MQLEWELQENKPFEDKINELTGSKILSQILANRGIDTYEKAYLFLNPLEYQFSNPFNFTDMKIAVSRIKEAIEKKQNIIICGDFDCDGVTSTSVLYKTLVAIGANAGSYIPNRKTESHGLNSKSIIEIISKRQAKLIITVDNGISNVSEIKLANSLGTDVIITDHHEPAEILPPACAIINPKCSDKLISTLNFNEIENMVNFAGVMVAYKLCCALLDEFKKPELKQELLPLVMLGTISDVMQLTNENRMIVVRGLNILKENQPLWLKKMFTFAEKSLDKIESETIAFVVAPRINAAGRLEHATTALELLVSDDEEKIDFNANQLNQFNQNRQQMCEASFKEAVIKIQNEIDLKTSKAIVLADEKWHIGIVGLLASRIVETYNRPAFIMNIDKEENIARCSIRGIKGFNVYKLLSEMEDCFVGFGGHELAGGFGADLTKISIKTLSSKINALVASQLEGNSLKKKMNIDAIISPEDLTVEFIEKLAILEPYGEGNKSCLFGMKNLVLKKISTIGSNNNHLKMLFEDENSHTVFEGLIWNKNSHKIELLDTADLTFVPQINEYKGNKTVQLIIKNIFIKNREIETEDIDFDENAKIQTILVDHRKKTDFFKMINGYLSKNNAEIYLENNNLLNQLDDYSYIKKAIRNRFDLALSEELMFFSTPCCEEDFSSIIKSVSPKKVHIFNCNDNKIDITEFIKKVSGMLKYSSTHYDNKIDIKKSLSYLSCSKEAFDLCLELLNDCNVIKLKEQYEDFYEFEFLEGKNLSELLKHEKYQLLVEEIERINNFKEEFQSCEFAQIEEMVEL
ncbi:MAG: single-stranded-DNA-specific exonuclease RecJ [Candidatus Gastranaerophilales bacterium]|nr:single-stranded-DNA-specific exonuclease RecJ [Candidatus Gastranaerophilales bacterium]